MIDERIHPKVESSCEKGLTKTPQGVDHTGEDNHAAYLEIGGCPLVDEGSEKNADEGKDLQVGVLGVAEPNLVDLEVVHVFLELRDRAHDHKVKEGTIQLTHFQAFTDLSKDELETFTSRHTDNIVFLTLDVSVKEATDDSQYHAQGCCHKEALPREI